MERQAVAKVQKILTSNHPHRQSARSTSAGQALLELQRAVGNQAIQRLTNSPFIQAKLQVSTPEDPSEQEADRVADSVMRMTEPQAQASEEEKEETIATKPAVPLAVREDDEKRRFNDSAQSAKKRNCRTRDNLEEWSTESQPLINRLTVLTRKSNRFKQVELRQRPRKSRPQWLPISTR